MLKLRGKNKKKMSKQLETNRIRSGTVEAKRVFLTIPHFDELEEVYKMLELESKKRMIDRFAVVLETHTADVNKGKHLHVFVQFTKRREISLKFFDFLGKHGSLEKVRSIEAVLQYMNKENVCKANFDVFSDLLNDKQTFANTVRLMMIGGWSEGELLRKYGAAFARRPWATAFAFGKKALAAERAYQGPTIRIRKITREIIEKRLSAEELTTFDSDHQFAIFVDYVNKILQYGNQQLHKQCCLSLVGEPSIGKTTVVNELKKFFYTYVFPMDGWHNQYDNGIYEIILWNEWDIKLLSRSDLLLFTEGEILDLRVKHTKAVKTDRPMIVLTSNSTYESQVNKRYGHDTEYRDLMLKALKVRFVELNFRETEIWFLTKLFVPTNVDV